MRYECIITGDTFKPDYGGTSIDSKKEYNYAIERYKDSFGVDDADEDDEFEFKSWDEMSEEDKRWLGVGPEYQWMYKSDYEIDELEFLGYLKESAKEAIDAGYYDGGYFVPDNCALSEMFDLAKDHFKLEIPKE